MAKRLALPVAIILACLATTTWLMLTPTTIEGWSCGTPRAPEGPPRMWAGPHVNRECDDLNHKRRQYAHVATALAALTAIATPLATRRPHAGTPGGLARAQHGDSPWHEQPPEGHATGGPISSPGYSDETATPATSADTTSHEAKAPPTTSSP